MSEIVSIIGKIATTLSGALSGGTIPAVIAIGKDVLKLIDKTKNVVSSDDAVALQAIRDELEPKVMAHADSTEDTLRG